MMLEYKHNLRQITYGNERRRVALTKVTICLSLPRPRLIYDVRVDDESSP